MTTQALILMVQRHMRIATRTVGLPVTVATKQYRCKSTTVQKQQHLRSLLQVTGYPVQHGVADGLTGFGIMGIQQADSR